jgi:mono/diheme cytochrome c family protein
LRSGNIKRLVGFGAAFGAAILLAGCSGTLPKLTQTTNKTELDWQPDMYVSPAVQPLSQDHLNPALPGMRMPPEGTVPTNWVPYPQDWDTANQDQIKNPLPVTPQVLETGRKLFNTYCIVCHGAHADGLGFVVPKMTQPPPLIVGGALSFSDGRIFTIITGGIGNMPPYQTELNPSARWAIVQYVRVLQRAANPSDDDIAYAEKTNGMNFSDDYPPAMTPNGPEPGTKAIPHN